METIQWEDWKSIIADRQGPLQIYNAFIKPIKNAFKTFNTWLKSKTRTGRWTGGHCQSKTYITIVMQSDEWKSHYKQFTKDKTNGNVRTKSGKRTGNPTKTIHRPDAQDSGRRDSLHLLQRSGLQICETLPTNEETSAASINEFRGNDAVTDERVSDGRCRIERSSLRECERILSSLQETEEPDFDLRRTLGEIRECDKRSREFKEREKAINKRLEKKLRQYFKDYPEDVIVEIEPIGAGHINGDGFR